jgi:hypothetical protein
MIAQEGRPSLGRLRAPRSFLHPAQHCRSEISKPSILSSPWTRGAPQDEFSATMRKMSSRSSRLTHFLPTRFRCRESHVQYNLNLALCQRTTVSGWTRINACFHPALCQRTTVSGWTRIRGPLPSRPKPPQDHPEQLVRSGKPRLRMLLLQNGKLLPKRHIFQEEVAARTNRSNK